MRGLVSSEDEAGDAGREWLVAVVRGEVHGLVPELAYAEVANALAVQARSGAFSTADAEAAVGRLLELPLEPVPLRSLVRGASLVAVVRGTSVYDGCYVALAEATGSVLVTADRRLAGMTERADLLPGARPPSR